MHALVKMKFALFAVAVTVLWILFAVARHNWHDYNKRMEDLT